MAPTQPTSRAHPASYLIGNGGAFPGDKAAWCVNVTTKFYRVPNLITRELYPHSPTRPYGAQTDTVYSFKFAECRRGSDTQSPPCASSVCIDHSQYSSLWGRLRLPWSLYTTDTLNTHSVFRRKTSLLLSLNTYSKWLPSWRARSIKFAFPTNDNT
jgi:hypothetical protein